MAMIYDDTFRTLCKRLSKLIIPFINNALGTHYSLDEEAQMLDGNHPRIIKMSDGEKVVTDSYFRIGDKYYHIECQSNPDGSMVLRMIEYDFTIAIEKATLNDEGMYEIDFPHSAVLYLRHTSNTPDVLKMKVNFVNGESVIYSTPIIKAKNYSLDDILENKLYFLIPFYIMRYEDVLKLSKKEEIEEHKEEIKETFDIIREMWQDVLDCFSVEHSDKYLTANDIRILIELSKELAVYQCNNGNFVEEVTEIMGGKVLEFYSDKAIEEARLENENLNNMLMSKLVKDKRYDDIEKCTSDKSYKEALLKEYKIVS